MESKLLTAWLRSLAMGFGVSLAVMAICNGPRLSSTSADPVAVDSLGRCVAAAAWVHSLARGRGLLSLRPRMWRFFGVLLSTFAAATACSLITSGMEVVWAGAAAGAPAALSPASVVEGGALAVLSACLMETVSEPRALAAWLFATGWLLPSLVGSGSRGALAAANAPEAPSLGLTALPCAASAMALFAAARALRCRVRG